MAQTSVIRFRCYQCNQLLGAASSKIGAVVSCRKCGAELIVPPPADSASGLSSDGEGGAIASGAAGSPQEGVGSGLPPDLIDIRPEDIRVEPGFHWVPSPPVPPPLPFEGLAPREVEAPRPVAPAAPERVPIGDLAPDSVPAATTVEVDAVLPPIKVETPRFVDRTPTPRSRDVVLPRSAVAAWSLFVLLAQGMAFVAGLLAGHYLWRVH